MKVSDKKIAVCSRSFSKHPQLRSELSSHFSQIKFNDEGKNLEGTELVNFLQGAEAAIIALEKINGDILSQLKSLRFIGKYGVGLDNIDFEALEKHQVKMGHTPGVNKRSVSELVIGFILNIYRKIEIHNQDLKRGIWKNQGGLQLSGRTVGIIGAGNVGQDLMGLLSAFNCKILFCDLVKKPELCNDRVVQVELEQLLKQADIVTVHIPYNANNKLFISKDKLSLMKTGSVFINTSRGGLVDEEALYQILNDKKIAAAAMDVFEVEPAVQHKLFSLPDFFATPHVGGSSEEAVLAMGKAAISHLVNYARS